MIRPSPSGLRRVLLTAALLGTPILATLGSSARAAEVQVPQCMEAPNFPQDSGHSGDGVMTPDARYLVFASTTSPSAGVIRLDRSNGTETIASVTTNGQPPNGASDSPVITPDGRYVAFRSLASNLVVGDTNAKPDVFVRDLLLGVTERVSVGDDESQADASGITPTGHYNAPAVSSDGRLVAFTSVSPMLTPANAGLPSPSVQVFVRDRALSTTTRESRSADGVAATGLNYQPSLTADGSQIVFTSNWSGFGGQSASGTGTDVVARDRGTHATSVVSGASDAQSGGDATISRSGNRVAFLANAALAGQSGTGLFPVVRDLATNELRNAFTTTEPAAQEELVAPAISSDGRYVSYQGQVIGRRAVLVRDLTTNSVRMPYGMNSEQGRSPMAVSDDGRFVSYMSGPYSYARRLWVGPTYVQSYSLATTPAESWELRQGAEHASLTIDGWNLTSDAVFDFGPGVTVNGFAPAANGRGGVLDL
ncbi:MAG: hypothetical protein Q8K63_08580, partial [Acidimicrobiales bacterium]|nr:hypothetical protein [Acidimicrobiales bacterium]